MAHKRKATAKDEARSSKKPRSPTSVPASTESNAVEKVPVMEKSRQETAHTTAVQPANTEAEEASHVEWALPTKADNKTINDSDTITQFAPLISHRPWLQTRTLRVPFQSSPLRSPLYRKKGSPDMEADSDKNKSSQCLVRLFNRIKRCTESPNDGTIPTTYQRAAFERAFGTGDEELAVVASTSSTTPIFTLSRDHQVDVTLRHEPHRQDHARINFIRRLPPGASSDGTVPYGYFIVVPPQTKLTINGQTYVNDEPREYDATRHHGRYNDSGSDFYIGPLQQFTVIELLSQPLFFFRTKADLDFVKRTAAKADAVEMSGRDKNGDVEEDIADIVWSLSDAPQEPVSVPDLPDQTEHSDHEQWVDDSGKVIEDACGYLRRCIWATQRDHFDELIPRVLTSINLRQPPPSGFSFPYNGRTFRPGRTLVTAVLYQNYHILLIVRRNARAETKLRILDPMAWRSRRAGRETLATRANEFIPSGNWRPTVASEQKDQDSGAPLPATWAPCAQRTNEEEASTFTILNAWAIALGFQVDPGFTPGRHGGEDFFTRAQWLFDRARRDRLDWKLLLAFFKCTRFVKIEEAIGDKGDQHIPPLDRRFRQSRTFEQAIDEQREADDADPTGPALDVAPSLAVRTGIGKAHSALFPADIIPDEILNDLADFINQGHWRLTETPEQLVERFSLSSSDAPSTKPPAAPTPSAPKRSIGPSDALPSGPSKPSAGTAPTAPSGSIEGHGLPNDFNACEYFHREMTAKNALVQSNIETPSELALRSKDVLDSIGTVARALNSLQPANKGITVIGPSLGEREAIKSGSDPTHLTDKIVLVPWQHEEHTMLVVAQSDSKSPASKTPTCHVVDCAPWTLKHDDRQRLRDAVASVFEQHWRPGHGTGNVQLAPRITWVWGPRQRELWQCGYYTVFNAWSVMLDCTLDFSFAPRADFFRRGRELVAVVLAGRADWKLVYAYLRCYGYVKQGEQSGEERRFRAAADEGAVGGSQTRDEAAPCGYDFSKRVHVKMQRPHDVVFKNWDSWDKTDVSVRLPTLFKADKSPLRLDTTQLRNAYHELVTQPRQSTADFADTDKPCVYLQAQLAALQGNEDTRQRLGSLRSGSSANTKAGGWLSDEEIALAIASVTLAITGIQDASKGFSAVSGMDVQMCFRTDREPVSELGGPEGPVSVPRFGRPLFVPIVERNHIVLGVVQLDRDDRLTVSIVDSKSAYYSRTTRNKVFKMVMDTAGGTCWWRRKFASWSDVPVPKTATWIPCAQQPGDDECGYSTILNGWALALGLELNPHAAPIWDRKAAGTDNLYQTVLDIVHLARLGLVDWRLLYAFLRCHRFVHEGTVPRDRRFTNTVRLQDDNELKERLQDLSIQELEHWTQGAADLNDIKGANTIQFPQGLEHTSFPEDGWGTTAKTANLRKANVVSALGHLHTRMSSAEFGRVHRYFCTTAEAQTKAAGEQIGADKATFFLDSLCWQGKAIKDTPREHLLDVYRDFLSNARSQSSSLVRLQKRHCAFAGEGLGLLRTLLANTELDKKLGSGLPQSRQGKYLDLGEVNLAIAAVVEAIDARQESLHRASSTAPFTGGFALATRDRMQIARVDTNAGGIVSRPRRCFLLPVTINDTDIQREELALIGRTKPTDIDWSRADESHHFLAVVQEESRPPTLHNPSPRHFCIYTLDSAPRRFQTQTVQRLFHNTVRNTATNLGWTQQRNASGEVRFRPQHTQIRTFPQAGGGWQCGLHTILNAWILALGLLPRSEQLALDADFYPELWVLVRGAVAGLLDWKALVAWLYCRDLVTSRALASVPQDRRFETTRFQEGRAHVYWTKEGEEYEFSGEVGLIERVECVSMQDLAGVLGSEVPYDYSGNVDFSAAAVVAEEVEEESDQDSEEEVSEEEASEEEQESSSSSSELSSEPSSEPSSLPSDPSSTTPTPPPETDEPTDLDAEGETDDELPQSLKRRFDDLDQDTNPNQLVLRKRVKLSRRHGDLDFLACGDGDGDGDGEMSGSPWRKVEGLAFLKAF